MRLRNPPLSCDETGVLVMALKKPVKFYLGDWIEMKKPHPCGGKEWEVMRVGMDFRLKCLTCGRIILIPRTKLEKGFKKIVKSDFSEAME